MTKIELPKHKFLYLTSLHIYRIGFQITKMLSNAQCISAPSFTIRRTLPVRKKIKVDNNSITAENNYKTINNTDTDIY